MTRPYCCHLEDAYFSGQAAKYNSAEQFKEAFWHQLYERAQEDKALKRFFASVSLAHPEALMGWGKSSVERSGSSGKAFAGLGCAKLYYWGKHTTSEKTQAFISSASIPTKQFTNSGHWPMIDQPDQCVADIIAFFMANTRV
ncbi:MAG: hypothetical protein AAF629_32430 [Chloroflexota bacterium]